jgi:hypothetical protein
VHWVDREGVGEGEESATKGDSSSQQLIAKRRETQKKPSIQRKYWKGLGFRPEKLVYGSETGKICTHTKHGLEGLGRTKQ